MKRDLNIDFLRGMAVLMVMVSHHPANLIPYKRFGGSGVDLFFGLSGFLVSGLLFKEYIRTGTVRGGLFLVKRGFKIYPLFYLFLALTVALGLWLPAPYPPLSKLNLLSEAFFMQSYLPHIWNHTWSIAVEEHFYILLAISLSLAVGLGKVEVERASFGWVLGALIAAFFLFRCFYPPVDYSVHQPYFYSHYHLEQMLWGVLLSWAIHFRYKTTTKLIDTYKWVLLIIGFIFLTLMVRMERDISFGLFVTMITLAYLSIFAVVCLGTKPWGDVLGKIGWPYRTIARVGFYSYSIYLFHVLSMVGLQAFYKTSNNRELGSLLDWSLFGVYMASGVLLGVLLSKLVEQPVLRLRERILPK